MPRTLFRWDNRGYSSTVVNGAEAMTKRTQIGLAAALVSLSAVAFFGVRKWSVRTGSPREEVLTLMPTDASAVLFADFGELRRAPFIAQLYAWAPKPQADADYSQFVKETGFDYERDLDRVAIAVEKRGQDSAVFALLDGKFDRQKISVFAKKDGTAAKTRGREIFSVPVGGTANKISFVFLRNDRIALTNDSNLAVFLDARKRPEDVADWRARFERLAGSPVFAVIRQDATLGAALAAQVAEGGLNDTRARQQLDPALREAYLELLKSADVSKIDRGDSKSVRLIFEITPAFLEAAHKATPVVPDSAQSKPPVRKAPSTRKGHI